MPTWGEYFRLKNTLNMPDDKAIPDELAYLDRLEGAAFQNAINRLTPEQLQRYEGT